MQFKKDTPCIPVALLTVFLIILLAEGCKNKRLEKAESQDPFPATGFADYDLLPVAIKRTIWAFQKDTLNKQWYAVAYYFDIDDVNYRYYIKDAGHEIVQQIPVTDLVAMDLVEERMGQDMGSGYYVAHDDQPTPERRLPWVTYTLPQHKEKADFKRLKVAVLKMSPPEWVTEQQYSSTGNSSENSIYQLWEVDETPEPIGGMDYFEEVVMDEVKNKASFLYYDLEGEVVVTFIIGPKAKSPNIVQDFNSQNGTYEAYQAGGIILRAINDSKVHWKLAKKDGKHVSVQLAMTFSFDKENQNVLLSMSEWPKSKKTQ